MTRPAAGTPTVSRDSLRQVLRNMGEAIVVIEPDGCIRRINPATCFRSATPRTSSKGVRSPSCWSVATSPTPWRPPLPDASRRMVSRADCGRGSENWCQCWLRSRSCVVTSVSSNWIVCIARDQRELLQAERLKDEFLSVVNHELRTPLTSIRGSLGLLKGGVAVVPPGRGPRPCRARRPKRRASPASHRRSPGQSQDRGRRDALPIRGGHDRADRQPVD